MSKLRVYVAGHRGMVGAAIVRVLQRDSSVEIFCSNHEELDLRNQHDVDKWISKVKPHQIYLAAAKVGGIHANSSYPADFIYDNLMIQSNVINAAYANKVDRLIFLGSSCIYPRGAAQPMSESALLTGPLEPTNEPYAIAKIAGIKLCESYNRQYGCDFRSVMPTNLYGPGDNFHPENSHVIPALIRRFHEALASRSENVVIWGSGAPLREFLYVDDLAEACVFLMNMDRNIYKGHIQETLSHLNVGFGLECSIGKLAATIASVVGYQGNIIFDSLKPDGAPRKLLDSSKIQSFGWRPKIALKDGLDCTYRWYLKNHFEARSC